jgi:fatty acid desaturase
MLPAGNEPEHSEGRHRTLWMIAVVLVLLWLLGGFAFHIGGGLIHILLVVALIVIVVNLLQGRRAI